MAATTVAATAMAAVTQASHGGSVATDQSKSDQGDERRERNSEKTLHFFLRSLNAQASAVRFMRPSTRWSDPGRPPNRSNREQDARSEDLTEQPAAPPCRCCRSVQISRTNIDHEATGQNVTVKQFGRNGVIVAPLSTSGQRATDSPNWGLTEFGSRKFVQISFVSDAESPQEDRNGSDRKGRACDPALPVGIGRQAIRRLYYQYQPHRRFWQWAAVRQAAGLPVLPVG